MVNGRPVLAVYYKEESTIRTYKLINGQFVPVDALAGFVTTSTRPYYYDNMNWSNDNRFLYFSTRRTNSQNLVSTDSNLSAYGDVFYEYFIGSQSISLKMDFSRNDFYCSTTPNNLDLYNMIARVAKNGQSTVKAKIGFPSSLVPRDIGISPDARKVIMTCGSNLVGVAATASIPSAGTPVYNTAQFNIGYVGDKPVYDMDGNLVIIPSATSRVTVFKHSGANQTSLEAVQTLPEMGVVNKIAFSPNKQNVAISYINGSSFDTVMYTIYGEVLVESKGQPVISGFGKDIVFTEDGMHMIDVLSMKMYSFNGSTWTLNASAISRVTAGGSSAAISSHIDNPVTETRFYDFGLGKLKDFDNLDLRMLLLKSTGSFVSSLTTVDNIPAAQIAKNSNWPVGDLPVTMTKTTTARSIDYHTTTVRFNSGDQPLSTRYAVIYDHSTKQPLMFYDFGFERVIPTGSAVDLSFSNDMLTTFIS